MRVRSAKATLYLSVCALALAACGGGDAEASKPEAAAADVPTTLEAACTKGVEEGALTIWGGSDEEKVRGLFDEFSKTYPGMTMEYLSIRPSEAAQRLVTEDAAGQAPEVDIVSFDPDSLSSLMSRNMVMTDINWEPLGVPASRVTEQDSVLWAKNATGITYNTDLVPEADLPNTWDDLLNPKWQGKVVIDPRGRPFDKMSLEWGKEKTLDYIQKLKANQPVVIEGGTAGMVAVGSGQALMTAGGLTIETKEQQATKAPLEIKYLDVITSEDDLLSVMAKSEHPNAAICFSAWLGTDEGQAATLKIGYGAADLNLPPGVTAIGIETPEDAAFVQEMSEEISKIWAQ